MVRNVPVEAEGKRSAKAPSGTNALDVQVEDIDEDRNQFPAQAILNGHHCPLETNGYHSPTHSENVCLQNGNEHLPPEAQMPFSSCSDAPAALQPSSPCTSPVLARCPPGSPSSFQSSYQAGINQRFHAARHKFQGTTEAEPQPQGTQVVPPLSPKDISPVTSTSSTEASPVKQIARSTVTQVLSRFTSAQQSVPPKLAPPNNSPFGTDYRSLAAPLSPVIGRAAGTVQQGIRSPSIPRAERGIPPPIPPKKPSLAQAPPSPAAVPRSHFSDGALSGSCGLISTQEGVKELDMVVSSN